MLNGVNVGPVGVATYQRIVAYLQVIVDENLTSPLGMEEISSQIGVSTRSLRAACQAVLGTNPTTYLLRRRLKFVRETMLQNPNLSVTDVATQCGFFELGRFAGLYRKRYGEVPSATLQRVLRNQNIEPESMFTREKTVWTDAMRDRFELMAAEIEGECQ
jgi:transcriptional regulator GlxA family with amidase domain